MATMTKNKIAGSSSGSTGRMSWMAGGVVEAAEEWRRLGSCGDANARARWLEEWEETMGHRLCAVRERRSSGGAGAGADVVSGFLWERS